MVSGKRSRDYTKCGHKVGRRFPVPTGGGVVVVGLPQGVNCVLGFSRDSSHLENQPRGSVENVKCGILLPTPYLEP